MGTLYVVATPIGNLEDLSFRAARVLREVALVAAEDTRSTRHLLDRYGISTPVTSYYEHNKLTKLEYVLSALETGDVALVSEAGTPGVSDPGYELVVAAIARGITVVPIPGPSAAVTALAVSGLPTDQFTYMGFFPRRGAERRRMLSEVVAEPRTLIFYEAPHRLLETLADIAAVLGNRRLAAARELTKVHEEIVRGTVAEVQAHFAEVAPRGEFTLVVEGAPRETAGATPEDAQALLAQLRLEGVGAKDAVARVVTATGLPRRVVYDLWLSLERER